MLGKNTVGSFPGRGDGAVVNGDGGVAGTLMSAIDAVGIYTLRHDIGTIQNLYIDIVSALMSAIDAVGVGVTVIGIKGRAFRIDVDVPDLDEDIASGTLRAIMIRVAYSAINAMR